MLHHTKGIVLTHVKYAETSIIAHIYTEAFGKQSYIINGVRTANNKGKSVFMQPLSVLDMEVYHHPKKEIQRIKEFRIGIPFRSIPFDQNKRSIAFFITEIMNKAFWEETSNPEMFQFVENAIEILDTSETANHFHLLFLSALTRYLGFWPDIDQDEGTRYFDLLNGHVTSFEPLHSGVITGELKEAWIDLFRTSTSSLTDFRCHGQIKNQLIDTLIDYYKLHLHDFSQPKTLEVLRTLLHQ